MILYVILVCLLLIVIILSINKNDICEGYSLRDFQLICASIDDIDDFRNYCEVYTGTRLFEKLNMSNNQKVKIAEDYLKGIDKMKQLSSYKHIPLNRTPKYGRMIKNNGKNNFSNFENFL